MNVDALFLGPKSENKVFFAEMLQFLMQDHITWRERFHMADNPLITDEEQLQTGFQDTLQQTREVLIDLAARLQISSTPWFSPRYLGHMTSDTIMAANLGYMLAMLYNPNNCAYEGAPATTSLELEVGRQLAQMLGYNPRTAWGHICSGGTIANYESLWLARNLKSIPLAVRLTHPHLVDKQSDWQLLNLSVKQILDLMDAVKTEGGFEAVRNQSIRGKGMQTNVVGKLLVPQSKHYSWNKAADILGIGLQNVIFVPVDGQFRMNIDALGRQIETLVADRTPILGVVGVVGSTEEGAVDNIHEIVALRDTMETRGISFYLHVDAAYGGYARTVFLDEHRQFLSRKQLSRQFESTVFGWPNPQVYEAFKALPGADSITIDPHKLGYIPYSAGALVIKDKRMLDLVSYFAAYVFDSKEDAPDLLGAFIMEGSKPGAAAAAVWVAHQLLPLHQKGYGAIIRCGIQGAANFYNALVAEPPIAVEDQSFKVMPLVQPDLNIVDFAFNRVGNTDLEKMNRLNQEVFAQSSFKAGPLYANDWITSKTTLDQAEYGDAPKPFITTLGIPETEWKRVGEVYVLRSTVMTPYLMKKVVFAEYHIRFMQTIRCRLREAVKRMGA